MSAKHRVEALKISELRTAALSARSAPEPEKPAEELEQERRLREEYERLLKQLDRKEPDTPQPSHDETKRQQSGQQFARRFRQ
jgi:hypothetical protein